MGGRGMKLTRKYGMIFVENSFLPFSGYKLINLCGIIFCRSGVTESITPVDANHEYIHSAQQKEMLVILFYLWYLIEWLMRWLYNKGNNKAAYHQIGFEQEAYMGERNLEYAKTRKHYCWIKYIF